MADKALMEVLAEFKKLKAEMEQNREPEVYAVDTTIRVLGGDNDLAKAVIMIELKTKFDRCANVRRAAGDAGGSSGYERKAALVEKSKRKLFPEM